MRSHGSIVDDARRKTFTVGTSVNGGLLGLAMARKEWMHSNVDTNVATELLNAIAWLLLRSCSPFSASNSAIRQSRSSTRARRTASSSLSPSRVVSGSSSTFAALVLSTLMSNKSCSTSFLCSSSFASIVASALAFVATRSEQTEVNCADVAMCSVDKTSSLISASRLSELDAASSSYSACSSSHERMMDSSCLLFGCRCDQFSFFLCTSSTRSMKLIF